MVKTVQTASCLPSTQEFFGKSPEQEKEIMKGMIKGWTCGVPSFQDVVDANKPEDVKLSKIYQRCASKLVILMHACMHHRRLQPWPC
jgi:hypothetical protein